jgi:hypothetical protein
MGRIGATLFNTKGREGPMFSFAGVSFVIEIRTTLEKVRFQANDSSL